MGPMFNEALGTLNRTPFNHAVVITYCFGGFRAAGTSWRLGFRV